MTDIESGFGGSVMKKSTPEIEGANVIFVSLQDTLSHQVTFTAAAGDDDDDDGRVVETVGCEPVVEPSTRQQSPPVG